MQAYRHRQDCRELLSNVLLAVQPGELCTSVTAARLARPGAPVRNRNCPEWAPLLAATQEMVLTVWTKASKRWPFGLRVPDRHWMYFTTPRHPLLAVELADDRSGAFRSAMSSVNREYIKRGGQPDCLLTAWENCLNRASVVHRLEIAIRREVAAVRRGEPSRLEPADFATGHEWV